MSDRKIPVAEQFDAIFERVEQLRREKLEAEEKDPRQVQARKTFADIIAEGQRAGEWQ